MDTQQAFLDCQGLMKFNLRCCEGTAALAGSEKTPEIQEGNWLQLHLISGNFFRYFLIAQ